MSNDRAAPQGGTPRTDAAYARSSDPDDGWKLAADFERELAAAKHNEEVFRALYYDNEAQRSAKGTPMKLYRRKGLLLMRPYVQGEDLSGVSINKEDIPAIGGMIAFNPSNPEDRWYVAEKYFGDFYEEV